MNKIMNLPFHQRKRQINKRNNRESIIFSSRKIFTERGFDNSSVREIVSIANLGSGTFYNYFDDKKRVFLVIIEGLVNEFSSYFMKKINEAQTFDQVVETAFNSWFNWIVDEKENYLFIKKNDTNCRNDEYNFLKEQYEKSNYIIFHARRNWYYLSSWFPELIQLIQNDDKKFIILLDDISHADLLDTYLKSHNKQPNEDQLNELEKLFFNHAKIWDKEILTKVRKILKKNNYKFLSRSELYCDYTQKKCPLIINNNKIYVDDGHLTNNGAKFFSNQGEKVIQKLLN